MLVTSLPVQLQAEMRRGAQLWRELLSAHKCLAGTVSGAVPKQRVWGSGFSSPPFASSPFFPLPRDCSQEAAESELSLPPGLSASPQAACCPLR